MRKTLATRIRNKMKSTLHLACRKYWLLKTNCQKMTRLLFKFPTEKRYRIHAIISVVLHCLVRFYYIPLKSTLAKSRRKVLPDPVTCYFLSGRQRDCTYLCIHTSECQGRTSLDIAMNDFQTLPYEQQMAIAMGTNELVQFVRKKISELKPW